MNRQHLGIALASLFVCLPASASSFIATTDTLGGALANSAELSTDMSFSLRDERRLRAARDDAASFVATQGQLPSACLEDALRVLRAHPLGQGRSDLQLAEAILAR